MYIRLSGISCAASRSPEVRPECGAPELVAAQGPVFCTPQPDLKYTVLQPMLTGVLPKIIGGARGSTRGVLRTARSGPDLVSLSSNPDMT